MTPNPKPQPVRNLLSVLKGEKVDRPPVWLMRQAGRYLPEYRETRAKAGSFLDLCYDPELATEVTLQPLRRFNLDAAILFADILLIPHAMGQHLEFLEGEGPKFDPIHDAATLAALRPEKLHEGCAPVYETVSRLRAALAPETTLIGFAGAPWTVATYMLGGKGPSGQDGARLWAYRNPALFGALMDLLVDATASYLQAQVRAGADVLQIFDSWAGGLPPHAFREWSIGPIKRIVEAVRAEFPDVPIIGFPRASGPLYEAFVAETGVDGVSIDTGMDPAWAAKHLQPHCVVQGNLDPMALVAGGEVLCEEACDILDCLGGAPYIFNLGHGIVPHTPPEHVGQLVEVIHQWADERT